MRVSSLGESGLIDKIKSSFKTGASVVRGIGDDCAVLKLSKDKYQLFCCDMITEGVDFRQQDDPYFIGRKAVAVSLSDIAACSGIPRFCLVSMGFPGRMKQAYFNRILKGIKDTAEKFNTDVVGGDLSRSHKLVINTSILGVVEKKRLSLRDGAKPGDVIFVTGGLGGSNYGRHLKFIPRLKEARYLSGKYKISSMVDISDGLLTDLGHILKMSSCGAVLYEELIPLNKGVRSINEAFSRGEDFELLFTAGCRDAKMIIRDKKMKFFPIGEIREKGSGIWLIKKNGTRAIPKGAGFKHF